MASDHHLRVYDSVIDMLSDADNPTPIVRLNKVVPFQHTRVYAKLEWYNPFGAIKDRVAANMIRDAEERGTLADGNKLVEATSGNTGLGLAMMGNVKGYPLRTPLSKAIPVEKRTVLRFLGSDVVELDDTLCPAPGAPEGAIAIARQTPIDDPQFVGLDQYKNAANPDSHYRTTGPEIWRQTGGNITHFVAGLGTCGTITGTGRFLKEQNAAIKVLGVYPDDGHDIPGVRSLRQLQQTDFFLPDEYDQIIEVSNRDSYDMFLRLNREESIIAGPSCAMALVGGLRMIPDEPGNVVVIIFPDNVFKYASSVCTNLPALCPASADDEGGTTSVNDLFVHEMMENLKNKYDTIKVKDLAELDGANKPLIIDVRPAEMYAQDHLPGAINIHQDELGARKGELPEDRDAPIVMVCGIGKFSKQTVLYLKSLGYRNARSLKGGINEWVRKGQATESTTIETT